MFRGFVGYKRRAAFLYPYMTGQAGQLLFKISAPLNKAFLVDMLPEEASRTQADSIETLRRVSGIETGQTASQSSLRHFDLLFRLAVLPATCYYSCSSRYHRLPRNRTFVLFPHSSSPQIT